MNRTDHSPTMATMMSRRSAFLALAGILCLSISPSASSADRTIDPDEAQIQFREMKERCSQFAKNIKRHHARDSEIYQQAARLYEEARIKNNAYVDQISMIMTEGRDKDLSDSAIQVSDAVNVFALYAKDKVKEMGAWDWIPIVAKALVENGIAIYDYVSKRSERIRAERAKAFGDAARWVEWGAL